MRNKFYWNTFWRLQEKVWIWSHASLITNLKTLPTKLLAVCQKTERDRKRQKKTRMTFAKLLVLNANVIDWYISFFIERAKDICSRFYRKWLIFFNLAKKTLQQMSSHPIHFNSPFIIFSGKFLPPHDILTPS